MIGTRIFLLFDHAQRTQSAEPTITGMTWAPLYIVIFLSAALAALGGLFLFGWKRRNDKMPKVAPLPRDDDWD